MIVSLVFTTKLRSCYVCQSKIHAFSGMTLILFLSLPASDTLVHRPYYFLYCFCEFFKFFVLALSMFGSIVCF
jgi:prepilin signal peptidase PulO-like enzyme (type II secretory pathway)